MHSIINDIYYCKYDSPIWYLRALFYYVLFSPIVLFFLKKGMCWILFIISAITCFTFPPAYDTFFYWLPVLLCFSYIGYKYPCLLFQEKLFSKKVSYMALLVFVILCIVMNENEAKSTNYYIFRMSCPFIFIPLMELVKFSECKYFKMTFFCYMIHGLFPPIAYQLFNPTTGNLWYAFLSPTFVLVTTLCVSYFVWKYFPSVFVFLTGGRK